VTRLGGGCAGSRLVAFRHSRTITGSYSYGNRAPLEFQSRVGSQIGLKDYFEVLK